MDSSIIKENIKLIQDSRQKQLQLDRASAHIELMRAQLRQIRHERLAYYDQRRRRNAKMDELMDKAAVVVGTTFLLATMALIIRLAFFGIDVFCALIWSV